MTIFFRFTCIFTFCFSVLLSKPLLAQQWEVGPLAGTAFYFGDLNPMFNFKTPRPSLAFLARRNFDGRMCFRMMGSFAQVAGDDAKSSSEVLRARNLSFRSNVFELSTMAEFNFIPFHGYTREDKNFTPYLSAGFSVYHFNPQAKYQEQWYNLQPLGTEGQEPSNEYSLMQAALLVGGGFKIALTQSWSMNIDVQSRILFTDYFDDVSGSYANKRIVSGYRGEMGSIFSDRSGELPDAEYIGRAGYQRGDNSTRDYFMTINIGLIYNFRDIQCPAY